ncbi:MAG: GNAT family N-acetyltransferase [Deltaproteobacteria bacterium]|nr:GNAT family N-acetyltransferase [Deltaproteobacteria bacterium]
MSPRVRCRPAEEAELPELAEIAHGAFHQGTVEGWRTWLTEHPHRQPSDITVARWDGRVVGLAVALRLTLAVAGKDLPMRGVAGVSVHPAYRQRGVGDALLRAVVDAMKADGASLSMLYPFRLGFYRRYGWGLCETLELFSGAPRALPASDLRDHVEPLEPSSLPRVREVYDLARQGATGPLRRSDWWWDQRVLSRVPKGLVYREPDHGNIDGYALYDVPEEPAYPRQRFRVRELCALTNSARRGLLGALHGLKDQYARCELCLPRGALRHLVQEFPAPDSGTPGAEQDLLGSLAVGAMARVLDLGKALAAHPFHARGSVTGALGLDLQDPCLGASTWDVAFGPSDIEATPGSLARERLSLGVDVFSQVYLGGESALDALQRGDAEGSPQAAALLDRALRGPAPFLGLQNHF